MNKLLVAGGIVLVLMMTVLSYFVIVHPYIVSEIIISGLNLFRGG